MITSQETVQPGAVVTFIGTAAKDMDFGSGYAYKVLVEQGKLQN